MRWRIKAKRFLNFTDALTAGVIQVQHFYGCAAHGGQSFDPIAIKPEVF